MFLLITHVESADPAYASKFSNIHDLRIRFLERIMASQIRSANLYFTNKIGTSINKYTFADVNQYINDQELFLRMLNPDNSERKFTATDHALLKEQIKQHAYSEAEKLYEILINESCVWDDIENVTYTFIELKCECDFDS